MTTAILEHSKLFFPVRRVPGSPLQVLFFSYAGGSASVFQPYANALVDKKVSMTAVQLPGRANRFLEPPISDWSSMRNLIRQDVVPQLQGPTILFGHSFGCRLAYETARIAAETGLQPLHLILSGAKAVHIRKKTDPIHTLADHEFRERLREIGGTPLDIIRNDELMRLITPMLKADFKLSAEHQPTPGEPLDIPVTCVYGTKDDSTPLIDVQAWQTHFCPTVIFKSIEAGHFFINTHRNQLAMILNSVVARCLERL